MAKGPSGLGGALTHAVPAARNHRIPCVRVSRGKFSWWRSVALGKADSLWAPAALDHAKSWRGWDAPLCGRYRANIRNPGWSPTTVMCPLHGEVSSSRSTSPAFNCLVSPSVAVIEKMPRRTVRNCTAGVG